MNILVIKQTSLGDVLHSTGHIRTIKENIPESKITLLTACGSYDLFRYNPNVHEFVLFEKDRVKKEWMRHPFRTIRHIVSLIRHLRKTHYDLAFDLQGRGRTVIFLYAARARRKYVKGRWPFLKGYRKPAIHAIEEMDRVLRMAELQVENSEMEIYTSADERKCIDELLTRVNPHGRKILIISPFTRWVTKNWGIENFGIVTAKVAPKALVIFTGFRDKREEIDQLIEDVGDASIVNMAGQLTLLEFAELIRRADLLLTGDSFPMHIASAFHTPLVALFGPTDEGRIGPVGHYSTVLRADAVCRRCYRRDHCTRNCISHISPDTVFAEMQRWLGATDERTAANRTTQVASLSTPGVTT